jgi:hypothetical protein
MVILADELLEAFFDVHFTSSWKLEEVASTTPSKQGFFSGFVGQVLTEEHRVRLKVFGVLTRLCAHAVWARSDSLN